MTGSTIAAPTQSGWNGTCMDEVRTLSAYAVNRLKETCQACRVPLIDECDDSYRLGVPRKIIRRWLETRGHVVSWWTLRRHYKQGHHA